MKESTTSFELREPASPETAVPDPILAPWMLPAALCLLLLSLAILSAFLKIRKKASPQDAATLRAAAFAEATAQLENLHPSTPREAAVQSSLILRRYLATAANDPALFETHEEFIARRDSLALLNEQTRATCATAFSRLASIKYSPHDASISPPEMSPWALNLLNQLHQGFQK